MSRTKRNKEVLFNNWRYKSNSHQDFKESKNCDFDGDLCGFVPKPKALLNAYDGKTPSAVKEVKYLSQTK